MAIVFDSSTLILLAKAELLRMVVGRSTVPIPSRVRAECLVKDSFDAILIGELVKEGKVTVEKVDADKATEKLMADFRLARGEAESLYLAMMKRCLLAVDDGVDIKAFGFSTRSL
jgi:predicted nucleic acid-binding protein